MRYTIHYEISVNAQVSTGTMDVEADSEARALEYARYVLQEESPADVLILEMWLG